MGTKAMGTLERVELQSKSVKKWNSITDTSPIGTDTHMKQIRAFIIGKGDDCTMDDVFDFIAQELLD